MGLIRIVHKSIARGVLIDQRDFNPEIHTRFVAPAPDAPAEAAPAGADAPVDPTAVDPIAAILTGSVAGVALLLQDIVEVPVLQALTDAEVAGKNRKGVLAAIDARNAALAESPSE